MLFRSFAPPGNQVSKKMKNDAAAALVIDESEVEEDPIEVKTTIKASPKKKRGKLLNIPTYDEQSEDDEERERPVKKSIKKKRRDTSSEEDDDENFRPAKKNRTKDENFSIQTKSESEPNGLVFCVKTYRVSGPADNKTWELQSINYPCGNTACGKTFNLPSNRNRHEQTKIGRAHV